MRRLSKKDIALVDALIRAAGVSAWQQDQGWVESEIEKAVHEESSARDALLKHILNIRKAADKP